MASKSTDDYAKIPSLPPRKPRPGAEEIRDMIIESSRGKYGKPREIVQKLNDDYLESIGKSSYKIFSSENGDNMVFADMTDDQKKLTDLKGEFLDNKLKELLK